MADKVKKCDSRADIFIRRSWDVASMSGLFNLMESSAREIGFEFFALTHHVDLRVDKPGIVNLNNYPEHWREDFIGRRMYADDPVHHACRYVDRAFIWSDIHSIVQTAPRHLAVLTGAARAGLRSGITVPIDVPGEPNGSCSFATRRPSLAASDLVLAHIIGTFAFAAARRLAREGMDSLRVPRLSPRQRECVVLVGQGKSDWEIGTILGLSPVTVKHYVENARHGYGVATRTQLVVSALRGGELTFPEIAPWQYVRSDA